MTLAFRQVGTVYNDAISPHVIVPKPAGLAAGDVMLAFIEAVGASLSVTASPAGWSLVGAETGNSNILSQCWSYTATGSEPSNYQWDLSASVRNSGKAIAYSGADASFIDNYAHGLTGGGSVTSVTPTVTAVGTGTALLVNAFGRHNAGTTALSDATGGDNIRSTHGTTGGGSFDFATGLWDALGQGSGSLSRTINSSGTEGAIAWHAVTIKPLAGTLKLRVYEGYVETPSGAPPLRLRVYGANVTSDSAAGGKSLRVYEALVEAPQPAGGIGESGIRELVNDAWQQITSRTLIGGEW